MKCWHVVLRRDFARYVHGELGAERVRRIENHLLDCSSCRLLLSRIRSGSKFTRGALPASAPGDTWQSIEAAIEGNVSRDEAIHSPQGDRPGRIIKVTLGATTAALILSLVVVALLYSRLQPTDATANNLVAIDESEFHPVSISAIDRSTRAHIVAEGYVTELKVNDEDGDLSFKLVENLGQSEPFIVCEIIDPIKLDPPRVGSRVKVYGVSRYDAESNHQWYEVHPVLSIESAPNQKE